ncbi:MAG TPA: hypothetical protein PLL50_05650 [Propionicimonas sp.]|nr:hypothetical protein [Propionicimonas sp.]HQA77823.1 hypothetical protein [Propionicimonas sp.]HQD96774.1 hypothetical protein [Propionicimonas sp.]
MVLLDLGSSVVTPSWLPLVLVIVLLGLVAFLYFNMRGNINRIDFEEQPRPASPVSPDEQPTP